MGVVKVSLLWLSRLCDDCGRIDVYFMGSSLQTEQEIGALKFLFMYPGVNVDCKRGAQGSPPRQLETMVSGTLGYLQAVCIFDLSSWPLYLGIVAVFMFLHYRAARHPKGTFTTLTSILGRAYGTIRVTSTTANYIRMRKRSCRRRKGMKLPGRREAGWARLKVCF
jgi:hypothetical protein